VAGELHAKVSNYQPSFTRKGWQFYLYWRIFILLKSIHFLVFDVPNLVIFTLFVARTEVISNPIYHYESLYRSLS